MAAEDELARRRYEKLVRCVEELMRGSLRPEYEGYGGSVVLGAETIAELGGSPDEIRRAARAVGRRLGWKTVTREIDGRVFILDDREPPAAVRELMQQRATDALDAAWGSPAAAERGAVDEPSRSSVRYLAEPFVLGALRRGRCVEQFLGPVGTPERPGIRYVEVRPVDDAFEIVLHTLRDAGHQGFVDVGEFPPLDADDEEEFGRLIATVSDALTALATAERRAGAVPARWVNAGIVQDEYADFVRAGRPSDASPDGHPWPVPTDY